jgi:uncharacterized protein (DUF427 family)
MNAMAALPVSPDPVGPGQESVWDYPRPPALVRSSKHVVIRLGETVIADSRRAWRVLETSHPPTWYMPREDVAQELLRPSQVTSTRCEWKGAATYWDVVTRHTQLRAAMWSYQAPTTPFAAMTGALTGYPAQLECTVDAERVAPQAGGFYGGWITAEVVGPFKGGPGSWGW